MIFKRKSDNSCIVIGFQDGVWGIGIFTSLTDRAGFAGSTPSSLVQSGAAPLARRSGKIFPCLRARRNPCARAFLIACASHTQTHTCEQPHPASVTGCRRRDFSTRFCHGSRGDKHHEFLFSPQPGSFRSSQLQSLVLCV